MKLNSKTWLKNLDFHIMASLNSKEICNKLKMKLFLEKQYKKSSFFLETSPIINSFISKLENNIPNWKEIHLIEFKCMTIINYYFEVIII